MHGPFYVLDLDSRKVYTCQNEEELAEMESKLSSYSVYDREPTQQEIDTVVSEYVNSN